MPVITSLFEADDAPDAFGAPGEDGIAVVPAEGDAALLGDSVQQSLRIVLQAIPGVSVVGDPAATETIDADSSCTYTEVAVDVELTRRADPQAFRGAATRAINDLVDDVININFTSSKPAPRHINVQFRSVCARKGAAERLIGYFYPAACPGDSGSARLSDDDDEGWTSGDEPTTRDMVRAASTVPPLIDRSMFDGALLAGDVVPADTANHNAPTGVRGAISWLIGLALMPFGLLLFVVASMHIHTAARWLWSVATSGNARGMIRSAAGFVASPWRWVALVRGIVTRTSAVIGFWALVTLAGITSARCMVWFVSSIAMWGICGSGGGFIERPAFVLFRNVDGVSYYDDKTVAIREFGSMLVAVIACSSEWIGVGVAIVALSIIAASAWDVFMFIARGGRGSGAGQMSYVIATPSGAGPVPVST